MPNSLNTIKVLYVFGGERASGAEIVMERLIRYNLQVEAHLFIAPGIFADKLLASQPSYKISVVPELRKLNRSTSGRMAFYKKAARNYFLLSSLVKRYARQRDIKIIHANTVVPASYLIPAILSSIFSARKFIWTDHDLKYFSTIDHKLALTCSRLYNRTITVSHAVKRKYRERKKIRVVHNGLDAEKFKHDDGAREVFKFKHNLIHDKLLIGMAATISPRKGQLELIEVLNEGDFFSSNVRLVIAGSFGEDNPTYNNKVKAAISLNQNILYLGQVDDMSSFYNGCDIIINNSSGNGSEPLGTTIYEAMACGKVVIASATGGTPEIIDDKIDGFLFAADDKLSLSTVLKSVVTNYASLEPVRHNAREKVLKKFSIQQMVQEYNNLLNEL